MLPEAVATNTYFCFLILTHDEVIEEQRIACDDYVLFGTNSEGLQL